jgi:hypothetical protein
MEEHAAASCGTFRGLSLEAKKKTLLECGLCTFSLRHPADIECFGKGSVSKPACKVPECKGQHAECLHEMKTESVLAVNAVECKEGEEEEGYVNLAEGECPY